MVRLQGGMVPIDPVQGIGTSKIVRTGLLAQGAGDAAWARPRAVGDEMPPPTDIPASTRRQGSGRPRKQTQVHLVALPRPVAKISPLPRPPRRSPNGSPRRHPRSRSPASSKLDSPRRRLGRLRHPVHTDFARPRSGLRLFPPQAQSFEGGADGGRSRGGGRSRPRPSARSVRAASLPPCPDGEGDPDRHGRERDEGD
jgi:hypothetical protein